MILKTVVCKQITNTECGGVGRNLMCVLADVWVEGGIKKGCNFLLTLILGDGCKEVCPLLVSKPKGHLYFINLGLCYETFI